MKTERISGARHLNAQAVWNLPIQRIEDGVCTDTTIGEAFLENWREENGQMVEINGEPILKIDFVMTYISVETKSGIARYAALVDGKAFNSQLLYELLKLHKKGLNPFASSWYCYNVSPFWSDGPPTRSLLFFLVADDKIVADGVYIVVEGSEEDAQEKIDQIFENPMRGADNEWGNAYDAYWYRRFYTETTPGKVMILRNLMGEGYFPEIYLYPKEQWQPRSLFIQIEGLLERNNALLSRVNSWLAALTIFAILAFIWLLFH